jgi:phosphate starvation-inducible PhoH-like protein
MLLTRLGWHSIVAITGDPDQTDLLPGVSGLSYIAERLNTLNDIAIAKLTHSDMVRRPLLPACSRCCELFFKVDQPVKLRLV